MKMFTERMLQRNQQTLEKKILSLVSNSESLVRTVYNFEKLFSDNIPK